MTHSGIGTVEAKISNKQDWLLQPPVILKEKNIFSADEVINAYFLGHDKGYSKAKNEYDNERFTMLVKGFEENLNKAKKICEDLYCDICKCGFKGYSIWLRSYSITNFDALFIVDKDDYINEAFLTIYSLGQEKRKAINDNHFNMTFSFMPFSEHINDKKLLADGYVLNYGKIQKH